MIDPSLLIGLCSGSDATVITSITEIIEDCGFEVIKTKSVGGVIDFVIECKHLNLTDTKKHISEGLFKYNRNNGSIEVLGSIECDGFKQTEAYSPTKKFETALRQLNCLRDFTLDVVAESIKKSAYKSITESDDTNLTYHQKYNDLSSESRVVLQSMLNSYQNDGQIDFTIQDFEAGIDPSNWKRVVSELVRGDFINVNTGSEQQVRLNLTMADSLRSLGL